MAKSRLQVIQGTTAFHFHTISTDLGLAVVSPEREAIFQYLSRLGSDRFVEFIADVLVEIEGHKLIDRTDGPGDEKQDILTLDGMGKRHLTQCKHTANLDAHANGDELDLMVSACMRKACHSALYVTNSDLTPQAKRYVTDKEYARSSTIPPELLPVVEYWNGNRIWERVSKSNAILNKWFGGTAQAHALRRFQMDIVITRMPAGESSDLNVAALAAELAKALKVTPGADAKSFDVVVDDDLAINLSDWFRAAGNLGVKLLLPESNPLRGHTQLPLSTVRIQALLSRNVGAFDPAKYRDLVSRLVANTLPDAGDKSWWHLVTTRPEALIFLQDVRKTTLVPIEESKTFVRVGSLSDHEAHYAFCLGAPWKRIEDPDDDGWCDASTGTVARVLVEEDAHPLSAYDMQLRQTQITDLIRSYTFRAINRADAITVDTIRRLCPPEWFVLQSASGDLFWAFPPGDTSRANSQIGHVLSRRGVEILGVKDEDRDSLIASMEIQPTAVGMIVPEERASLTPILLNRRTFWLSREKPLPPQTRKGAALEILKFKIAYESQHGFDKLGGSTEFTFAAEELRSLLFDPMTFRGSRMLDVAVSGGSICVHFRVRSGDISSAEILLPQYAKEFETLWIEVQKRLL